MNEYTRIQICRVKWTVVYQRSDPTTTPSHSIDDDDDDALPAW